MQQYFVNGRAPQGMFQISDKDTAKHMFSVMRLQAGDQIVLVFDDVLNAWRVWWIARASLLKSSKN